MRATRRGFLGCLAAFTAAAAAKRLPSSLSPAPLAPVQRDFAGILLNECFVTSVTVEQYTDRPAVCRATYRHVGVGVKKSPLDEMWQDAIAGLRPVQVNVTKIGDGRGIRSEVEVLYA